MERRKRKAEGEERRGNIRLVKGRAQREGKMLMRGKGWEGLRRRSNYGNQGMEGKV